MPTSRDRVMASLNFTVPDRIPKDLAGMRSTGISAFAYPKLVAALGLPPRLPRVEDTGQMLALPDLDVLDALGCDVITICDGVTNAFAQPKAWHEYDFNGRLPALVRQPKNFRTQEDGSILQKNHSRMVSGSTVFDQVSGGHPLNLEDPLPHLDLAKYKAKLEKRELSDTRIRSIRALCKRVRESTDRAIFLNDGGISAGMGIDAYYGLAIFPLLCVSEPNYVTELHEMVNAHAIKNARALLPEIKEYVDVIMVGADDWGTQQNLIASPRTFRRLFQPYYRRLNDEIHSIAPGVKSFLHSCGAIYDILEAIIDSGFDVLNPVQWPAGGHSYNEWKEKTRGRIALWGGAVNAQATLALGTPEEIAQEAKEVVTCLADGGGYIFCNIHNLLAEITPEKILALYRAID